MEKSKLFGGSRYIWSMLVFGIAFFAVFLLTSHEVKAAASFEYVWFRIDTELNVLNAKGVTITWKCDGSGRGVVTDGTASESVNSLDGIIKVASQSKEMTDAGCNTPEAITATASIDGWITRTWSDTILASTTIDPFTTRASMDYNFVVGPINQELGTELNLNGTAASASYSGTTASASYSNAIGSTWRKYIAATGDGTLRGGADGYVTKTISVTWSSVYGTTSKSAAFDGGTTSGNAYHGNSLPFGVKVAVSGANRYGTAVSGVGRTVTAGNSFGTSCTNDTGTSNYYCAVPLTDTGVQAAVGVFEGLNSTLTCSYTDRTLPGDVQSTCSISATEASTAGGSGSYVYVSEPTPTPAPSPSSEPTPLPSETVTPTPAPVIPTPTPVSSAVLLFRKANDPKVYVQKSDGMLSWVKTLAEFNAAGYKWADVKVVSGTDFAKMKVGGSIRVAKGIAFLRVRSGPSTTNKVVGKVSPNQELKFTEIKNGWYHIDSGWVSGAYVKEF